MRSDKNHEQIIVPRTVERKEDLRRTSVASRFRSTSGISRYFTRVVIAFFPSVQAEPRPLGAVGFGVWLAFLEHSDEFIGGNTSLAQYTRKRAYLHFTMQRDYAANRTAAKHNMAALLT